MDKLRSDDSIHITMVKVRLKNRVGEYHGVSLDYELKLAGHEINLEQVRWYSKFNSLFELHLCNGTVIYDPNRELTGFIEISVPGIRSSLKIELNSQVEMFEVLQPDGGTKPMEASPRAVKVVKRAVRPGKSSLEEFFGAQTTEDFSSQSSPNAMSLEKAFVVLGVAMDAPKDEIDKAYRQMVKSYHPDRVLHLGKKLIALAHEETTRINRAYERLKETFSVIV